MYCIIILMHIPSSPQENLKWKTNIMIKCKYNAGKTWKSTLMNIQCLRKPAGYTAKSSWLFIYFLLFKSFDDSCLICLLCLSSLWLPSFHAYQTYNQLCLKYRKLNKKERQEDRNTFYVRFSAAAMLFIYLCSMPVDGRSDQSFGKPQMVHKSEE